jgi:tetratricopeptide (TPR) repeat protein
MLSNLYAIALLLAVLALPYLIAAWNLRHTTLRCMKIEPAEPADVPEHLKAIFKEAIAEIEPDSFNLVSFHKIEQGSEQDGTQWGALLQHSLEETYVLLMSRQQLVDSAVPLTRLFMTLLGNETRFTTVNSPFLGIYSPDPHGIIQYVGTVEIVEQWQAHQQKLAELSQTQPPQMLSIEGLLKLLETSSQNDVERWVKNREVSWVTPGESYRMNGWTAIKAVYQVARKRKQLLSSGQTKPLQADASVPTAASVIELEIEEFHRLQQKQKNGISQRNKSWLLLGTLALFIASYSSLFEPHRLFIFIAALLFHEGGHVLAMKIFGYRDTVMLFIPFLGALATARKDNASLTEKVWILLAGPLPGLALGIGLAIASSPSSPILGSATWLTHAPWIRESSWILISLNLFNLLPIYPLDGGQVADLLLFSRNPYLGVAFKGLGILLLGLLGLINPLLLAFALLIALSIPTSFRLAKLNARFRSDLRKLPQDDKDGALRFLFTQLQEPSYRSLPFAQKYRLVLGLLDTRYENTAKWHVRTGLTGIYLISLLSGFIGVLYALIPNWSVWTKIGHEVLSIGETRQKAERRAEEHRQKAEQKVAITNQSLQANPKDVQAYLDRGQAKLVLQDPQGAIADASQVLQINPNSSEAYRLRARARQIKGDLSGATTDQQKATALWSQSRLAEANRKLKQNPKDAEAYLDRARLYFNLSRNSEVIADCDRALLIDPKNIETVLVQGEAYLALNKQAEALKSANQALKLDPNSGEAYELRSQVRRKMGDEAGAIADQQKADQE